MSGPARFAVVSSRVVTPAGVAPQAVIVDGPRIKAIVNPGELPADIEVVGCGDLVVMPGLVDTHVHVNEPGRTEWEGVETATKAAAAGGITTLIDMPLNSSPVTTTARALRAKCLPVAEQAFVDVGFYGGLVPGNRDQLNRMIDAGVFGIKAFLCDSGLDEFLPVTEAELRAAMPILAHRGIPLLVHAELTEPAAAMSDARSYQQYLASRPPEWETAAIELLIDLCREYCCGVHVVHLANGDALPMITAAKREGLSITVETCPHYLFFAAEDIPDGDPRFKCAPPIRERRHQEILWEGVLSGEIDFVASDHSPCLPVMKHLEDGNLADAWGGIASLQLTLPVVWTRGRQAGLSLSRLTELLSTKSSHQLGLKHKGAIARKKDADLVIWDPDAEWTVRGEELHHRHNVTPYDGERLFGRVVKTYLGGRLIYDHGRIDDVPRGGPLCRGGYVSLADHLNLMRDVDCREVLLRCCGSEWWVDKMLKRRPFADTEAMLYAAKKLWWRAPREAWLEAFAAHPRIGDTAALREKFPDTRQWAEREQAGAAAAKEATLRCLAEQNQAYLDRFGYIFIVCATGKTAERMLALLESRLENFPDEEIQIAAAEQLKITKLRLGKLLA